MFVATKVSNSIHRNGNALDEAFLAFVNIHYDDEVGETPIDIHSKSLSIFLVWLVFKRQFIQTLDGISDNAKSRTLLGDLFLYLLYFINSNVSLNNKPLHLLKSQQLCPSLDFDCEYVRAEFKNNKHNL